MKSETGRDDQKKRSFIEQARRTQIIAAAIETIAEFGYASASLARIAERVGISKGVISYHFAGKEELMDQVVEQVYFAIVEEVTPRVSAADGPRETLREHILAVGDYMLAHRSQLMALAEIQTGARTSEGRPRYGIPASEPLFEALELYFINGQETGVFRHFDRRVMSVTLQSAVDGALGYWVVYPEHDLAAHMEELAETMDRAVLADPA
ncbi:MAG: TetR/AcrR family transcriptional regulator [Stackebrandtia sp.]